MKIFFSIIVIFYLLFSANTFAQKLTDHRIAVVVNDQIITSYEIIKRMKISSILMGVNINPGENKELLNRVVEELIREKLKNEKINEYNITLDIDEYKNYESNFFERRNLTKDQFIKILKKNNLDYQSFKQYLENEILWQKLIGALFYRLTSASDIEIDDILSKNPSMSVERAENNVIQRQLDLKGNKLLRDMLNEATIEYR